MSLFDDHIGVWCGPHLVIDNQGREIERFEATVVCRREGDRWHQLTTRAWPDGRATETEFYGTFDGEGVLRYEHGNLAGEARAIGDQDIVSIWKDRQQPNASFSALVTLLSRDRRVRTVQKIEGNKLVSRILVKEARVH